MTTPTDRVRAALSKALNDSNNIFIRDLLAEALSELDGMVLVPVEPTVAMGLAWNKAAMDCASYFSTAYYKAMIKPYIKDE